MNPRTLTKTISFSAFFFAHGILAQSNYLNDNAARQALQTLSIDSLFRHVAVLGHDSLQGRATGSSGSEKAAYYIASQLQKLGLQSAASGASYFQNIPLHSSVPEPESQFQIVSNESVTALNLWQDYILYSTGAHTFIPTPLPLVFVGYGFIPLY